MNQHHDNLGAEAFAIFEKKLASEIANENVPIRKNIALRSDSIYAHINSIELRSLDGQIAVPFEGLDKAVDVPGGRHIRCNRRPGPVYLDIPLSKLARGEETKLFVSKQCACHFPRESFEPTLCISDIDTEKACFNMNLLDDGGSVAIFGKVSNLSSEDFQSVVDDNETPGAYGPIESMLSMDPDFEFTSPNAIFEPTHVQILVINIGHPGILKSLRLLRQPVGRNEDDDDLYQQRKLVFSVTSNPHNLMLNEKNRMLKLEQIRLDDLQDIIESIELSDGEGNSICELMNRGIRPEGGALSVLLSPSVRELFSMENLHEMRLSVSGVLLQKTSVSVHPHTDSGTQFFQLYIEYDVGVTLIGNLDFGSEVTERLFQYMTDTFFPRFIQNLLEGKGTSIPFQRPFTLMTVYFNDSWTDVLGKIHALLPRTVLTF